MGRHDDTDRTMVPHAMVVVMFTELGAATREALF